MKLPTVYEIEKATIKKSPYFFKRNTMNFFGQTMDSFEIERMTETIFELTAPMIDRSTGRQMGITQRFFSYLTEDLHLSLEGAEESEMSLVEEKKA